MKLKDRIVGFERLDPSVIRPNPKNWRTHPTKQRDVLKGVLADVGIVDAVLVRKLDDGTYRLVDGHLRAEEITKQPVPALIVDLNDREEAEVLATFDPVGDLAGTDKDVLRSLLQDFNSTNAAVQDMCAGLLGEDAVAPPDDDDPAPDQSDKANVGFIVLVECDDEDDQLRAIDDLLGRGYKCRALT